MKMKMKMKSSIFTCLLIFIGIVQLSIARGEIDGNKTFQVEERSLNNNQSKSNNNQSSTANQRKYKSNNYYHNYNNNHATYYGGKYYARNHYSQNHRYYRSYGGYYAQQSNNDNNGSNYYNDYYTDTDDKNDEFTNPFKDNSILRVIPDSMVENVMQFYQSSPSEWTGVQWAWFSGSLVTLVLLLLCCCMGCASLCLDGQSRAVRTKDTSHYDDYTSMDGNNVGSFGTGMSTAIATVNDSGDDDSSYDSIMRLRSSP